MKSSFLKFGVAMLTGVGIGAVAIHTLHAQTKPPVYYIAAIDVSDPEGYGKEYAPKARENIKASGGRFLATGGAAAGSEVTAFDGEAPKRVVVIQWDSMNR